MGDLLFAIATVFREFGPKILHPKVAGSFMLLMWLIHLAFPITGVLAVTLFFSLIFVISLFVPAAVTEKPKSG